MQNVTNAPERAATRPRKRALIHNACQSNKDIPWQLTHFPRTKLRFSPPSRGDNARQSTNIKGHTIFISSAYITERRQNSLLPVHRGLAKSSVIAPPAHSKRRPLPRLDRPTPLKWRTRSTCNDFLLECRVQLGQNQAKSEWGRKGQLRTATDLCLQGKAAVGSKPTSKRSRAQGQRLWK